MGCFIVVLAFIGPRIALAFTWIFTSLVSRAYDQWVVPVIGFVLLPWTTLVYAIAYAPGRGVSAFGWLLVAIALLADVNSWRASMRSRRRH